MHAYLSVMMSCLVQEGSEIDVDLRAKPRLTVGAGLQGLVRPGVGRPSSRSI